MDDLWRWPAVELAKGIRGSEFTARDVVTSCLERIEAVNPTLNALVEVSADEALDAAARADEAASSSSILGPLHGIPVSIKVNSDEAGHATTGGISAFADHFATVDSPQARTLREAGAIFVGRSNTPCFSLRWFTDNQLHGRTLNPWNEARTPGGSSGGASSAVASGMVPIAHGNDIGGSIRYPAYATGVVGLRPTLGLVPGTIVSGDVDAGLAVQAMAVQGPLARCIDDVRLALHAMSGYDPRDPFCVPGAPAAPPSTRPRRVGVVRDVGIVAPTPSVNGAIDAAARWLAEAGYEVEEVELPLLAEAHRLWTLLVIEDIRPALPGVEQLGDDSIKRAIAHLFTIAAESWGPEPGLAEFRDGYARRGTLIVRLQQFMEEFPLLLMPVSAEEPFENDLDIADVDMKRRLVAAQWPSLSVAVLGFPGLSIPTGITDGLPAGVQLLGRRFDEDRLLDTGRAIEERAGTFTPIEPRF